MKQNKIGIIGHVDHGKTTLTAAMMDAGVEVEDVNDIIQHETGRGIIIASSNEHPASYVRTPLLMRDDSMYSKRQRFLPEGTDIIKEYELIQRKASTLSRWERDQVVKIFEHNFKAL